MTMKLLRLLSLFLFTAAPAFAQSTSLYWAPENVTQGGRAIDGILNAIFWLTVSVFFATQITYVIYIIRYRKRPGVKAQYSHGNNTLEVIWTAIPVAIFLGLAIYGNDVWSKLHSDPPADAVKVNISAYQFGWDFRYAGADGKLGQISVDKISLDNKFGVDPLDEAGKDDFTTTELVIPANKAVSLLLNTRDVIHSFYVPSFRLYQDIVPGRTISWVWFVVEKEGNLELACSQLCGTGHYNMKAPIKVLSQEEFDKWYQEKAKAAAEARAAQNAAGSAAQTASLQ